MDNSNIGRDGSGNGTYTKYEAAGAPVTKHGGNTPIQDAVESTGGQGTKVDNLTEGFGK